MESTTRNVPTWRGVRVLERTHDRSRLRDNFIELPNCTLSSFGWACFQRVVKPQTLCFISGLRCYGSFSILQEVLPFRFLLLFVALQPKDSKASCLSVRA
eukprot:1133634-Pelagomonas_calceolata.AAC.1